MTKEIGRGTKIKYDREFMFGKISKDEIAIVVMKHGNTILLDNGQALCVFTDKFKIIK